MRKVKKRVTTIKPNNYGFLPPTDPFHIMFPVHLNYKERDEIKDCYFKDKIDLEKHLKRYNIKKFTVSETLPRN